MHVSFAVFILNFFYFMLQTTVCVLQHTKSTDVLHVEN